ncbi:CopG family transcriptional regulator [Microcoleus sp. herbarium14]|uniref:ribbon-helix-helix domain-containing protein n=1 Tax=Microcoleus sp. herbarium14 TaxID=3055439 RepID=UPI002FD0650F
MSRFDDLLKAKKLKPGEPDLSDSTALSKSKDPNFVRTTVYLPKQLHRQLKSAAAQSGREMSSLVEKSVAQYLQQFDADSDI